MKRVIAYIDGFNLYHSIDELKKPRLKWLNLWSLCESICRDGETLQEVHYFSAYYTANPARYAKHRNYVKALTEHGVQTHIAKFKKSPRYCKSCSSSYMAWEEKETDVHVAVTIVEHAFQNKFDRAVIITADTDILPPIKSVTTHFPDKEVFVAAPPKRRSRANALNPKIEITPGRIAANQLPDEGRDQNGKVIYSRPPDWV